MCLKHRLICYLILLCFRQAGKNTVICPLGGVSPKALERFLSERRDIESVFIATDNDEAGKLCAAEKLAELVPQEILVYRFLPHAKDWNEELINEQKQDLIR